MKFYKSLNGGLYRDNGDGTYVCLFKEGLNTSFTYVQGSVPSALQPSTEAEFDALRRQIKTVVLGV